MTKPNSSSGKWKTLIISSCVAVAAATFFGPRLVSVAKSTIRTNEKAQHMHSASSFGKPHSKAGGHMLIGIQSSGSNLKIGAGSTLNLEAVIEAQTDLEGLEYAWMLPQGVRHLRGEQKGVIGKLANGETQVLTLSVESESEANQQLHLHVYRMVNGEAQGQMIGYNTVTQPEIEARARRKAEALIRRANSDPNFKIFQ